MYIDLGWNVFVNLNELKTLQNKLVIDRFLILSMG